MSGKVYTSKEVAEELAVGYRRLVEWVSEGLLRPVRDKSHRRGNPHYPALEWAERDLDEARVVVTLRRRKIPLPQIAARLRDWRESGTDPLVDPPPLRIDPLAIASTDDLVAELRHRFPRGMIVAGICEAEDEPGCEAFFLDYTHGLTVCIGLAERAKARLVEAVLTPSE